MSISQNIKFTETHKWNPQDPNQAWMKVMKMRMRANYRHIHKKGEGTQDSTQGEYILYWNTLACKSLMAISDKNICITVNASNEIWIWINRTLMNMN